MSKTHAALLRLASQMTDFANAGGMSSGRTKNVPWHILAPAAVAYDIYLIRRSAHPRGAFFTLQESNFL